MTPQHEDLTVWTCYSKNEEFKRIAKSLINLGVPFVSRPESLTIYTNQKGNIVMEVIENEIDRQRNNRG